MRSAPARWARAGPRVEQAFLWGTIAVLAVLILYPLLTLLLRSLQPEDLSSFTLDNYREVLRDPRLLRAVGNSLVMSAGTAGVATILGVSLAWINARTNTPGARILGNLNLVPFFTSPFVGAVAWTILASKNRGLLNQWAASLFGLTEPALNIYSPLGIIWVLALFDAPVVYLFAAGAFRKMDPSLEEAARVAGSGLLGTALRVTLPLAVPSILAAALLIFVTALGAFEVPLALGIPARYTVITTELFAIIAEPPVRYNLATAMCSLLLLVTGLGLVVQRKIILRRDYITVTGKGYRPNRIDLGRGRYLALGWNVLYLLVAVALPLFALLAASPPTWSSAPASAAGPRWISWPACPWPCPASSSRSASPSAGSAHRCTGPSSSS